MPQFYQQTVEETFQQLQTTYQGLSNTEAEHRLRKYGPNSLTEKEQLKWYKILFSQLKSPLIYLLILAGGVTFLLHVYKDSFVIFLAVISNALIGFFQEFHAERSMQALKKLLIIKTVVLRDDTEEEISSEKVVQGDIILLTAGSKVPADMRLIEANDLTIDESMLTGESVPVIKEIHTFHKENVSLGDQKNMAFAGTSVVRGQGKGVVVATGDNTVLGKIASEVETVEKTLTPLQIKMNGFARFIAILVLSGAFLIFVVGLLKGIPPKEIFLSVVAVAVAAIPEGLPVVVTVAMAIGVERMARKNTLIRTLASVETLGSTTVICTDKTGTLTKNEMTVKKLFDGVHEYEVTGDGYSKKGSISHEGKAVKSLRDGLLTLLRIGAACNDAHIVEKNKEFSVIGDPMEGALLLSAYKGGIDFENLNKKYKRLDVLPFDSGRYYMTTLNEHEGVHYVFVKGAFEEIADLCKKTDGQKERIKASIKKAEEYAHEGLRVLAMAYKTVPASQTSISKKDLNTGLHFAGIQGMMDPPHDEVIKAIEQCKTAGIRVVMITGDHAITARAIGAAIGICEPNALVLTGEDLSTMTDKQLYSEVERVSVFARVSPDQKLRIVNQLMKNGEVVAVTGDGVNDAPGLRAAHIGVAMGKNGTDVAKEAANIVLRDDKFPSIVKAVYEGRVVFDNIRKAVVFLIPTGFAAIITILLSFLFNVPLPYLPVQLLWINVVASGVQDVALSFEPGEKSTLKKKPRDPAEGILTGVLLQRSIMVGILISVGVFAMYMFDLYLGFSLNHARTIAVTTMVFFQFFQVWNARSERESIFTLNPFTNMFLFLGLVGSMLAHICVMYIPAAEWLFSFVPMSFFDWIFVVVVASSVILLVEAEKAIRRYL
jgi:Ca2+-transporting ATPase